MTFVGIGALRVKSTHKIQPVEEGLQEIHKTLKEFFTAVQ